MKRGVDVVIAAVLLVGSAPLLAAIALLVRLSSAGPILHRAQRVGRGGLPFTMFKFRTMVRDAALTGPSITAAGDERLTSFGARLRRSRLDELPQLWNVLRGEMSLVGPRPEDPRFVAHYTVEQRLVLSVRPGLTGPAQLAFRDEESLLATVDPELTYLREVMPGKLMIDLEYVRSRSLAGDLRILARTARELLSRPIPSGNRASREAGTIETLLIVSHVVHYCQQGRIFAYGPYAREIDLWAELFPRVVIAAPCRYAAPSGDCVPLRGTNISLRRQLETGGESWHAKAWQLAALPGLSWGLARAMARADAIHVRCPGNLGLLGVLLAPLFSRRLVAKYAGQWNGYPGEPATYRLQRWLLKSRWWRGAVTVYGAWPDQPQNVVPFFTSMLTAEDVERARRAVAAWSVPRRPSVLYVGRLTRAKNVALLLRAIARLRAEGLSLPCWLVGEGPEQASLEQLARDLGLKEQVRFVGGVPFEEVLRHYERADILVLVSETEGWPKAIAEAMAFGLVCVGSNRGLIPEMLGDGRGLVVEPGDLKGLAEALREVAAAPEGYREMRARAAAWGQQHTLNDLRQALRGLLEARWGGCRVPQRREAANGESR